MADKGSPRYYEELLDTAYRLLLSLYIFAVACFWVVWIFSHHAYGGLWYILLAGGIVMAGGYTAVYYTRLPEYLSHRYQRGMHP